jgi:preprotein translocase subunit YajC
MPQDSGWTQLLFMYGPILLIFYFLVIAPQRKKQKEMKVMLDNLKKNDEVVTSSGVHGTVVILKDKTVVIRVDDNCRIEFDKEAVVLVKSESVKPEVVK